jgi:TPR repeat protein
LNAAEIAHYQQKYKSAISLYRFLREYVINFHVAYRLYVYYFNGLGGLEKDTNKALQYVKEAIETADPTDPLSNYDLANLYESGHGFKKDEELSLKLYAVAAEQNCSKAQYNLGLIYSAKAQAAEQKEKNSDAVEQNKGKKRLTSQRYYKKSFKYFKMSADQGFPGALCNLGVMYQLGEGVEQDSNRAIEYYKLAAEENYAVAHYNLGLIYEIGLGDVPMNLDEAVRCYEKASLSRHGGSEFSLATMYKKGRGVCKDYDISFHYFQKSARHGCVRAYYYIGNMYRKGQGVPMKDKEMALQYYLKAAQFQYCKAYNKLGLMYARGSGGIDRDYQQAVEFYKLGADHGSSRAQYNLGVMYERGKGIQTNPEMAFYYFKLSAEQGYVKAQYNLGWMYQNGRGVVVDNRKAIEYLTKASEQKSPEALYYLGWLYFYGEGTDVDKELAIEHWKLSAFLGYKKARQILEEMAEKNILFM